MVSAALLVADVVSPYLQHDDFRISGFIRKLVVIHEIEKRHQRYSYSYATSVQLHSVSHDIFPYFQSNASHFCYVNHYSNKQL